MKEAFFDAIPCRYFSQIGECDRWLGKGIVLRFQHTPEIHELAGKILISVNASQTGKSMVLKVVPVLDAP